MVSWLICNQYLIIAIFMVGLAIASFCFLIYVIVSGKQLMSDHKRKMANLDSWTHTLNTGTVYTTNCNSYQHATIP